jgi:predicted acylesterase/phospholipase RssA
MANGLSKFHEVFQSEVEALNARRKKLQRNEVVLEEEDKNEDGSPILRPKAGSNLVGLALSGGGVRSAAFCLGVLQGLDADKLKLLPRIDYLSTVSGGGYIGTSMTAAMTAAQSPEFPFRSELRQNEPPAIQHVRDHSNYLFPQGRMNVFYNIVIYLRGLAANAVLVLPVLLLAAVVTIALKPTVDWLGTSTVANTKIPLLFDVAYFALTVHVIAILAAFLAIWAVWRSLNVSGWAGEIGSTWTNICGVLLLVILATAFCEIQPAVLDGMFKLSRQQENIPGYTREEGGRFLFAEGMKYVAGIFASFAAVIGFFSRNLANILKRGAEQPHLRARMSGLLAKLAIYAAGAAFPLVLWFAYIYLSYWGIEDCTKLSQTCYAAPDWVTGFAQFLFGQDATPWHAYLVAAASLFFVSLILRPNANSLHRLYRDRLSKAFLFDPARREDGGKDAKPEAAAAAPQEVTKRQLKERMRDLAPLDELKLSKLACDCAPYQLINTALNIHGSKYANRRGRNADFFVFSQKFTGSAATGYVATETIESQVKQLDVATAMAISGAAASANMGSSTIKALVPTLALLNVRLGYWLPNPNWIATNRVASTVIEYFDHLYFLNEIFGLLREDSGIVYLTDGGHVENLGIYELLRRRCELIIAVDAEADPNMTFNSLVLLERYARIDLGVRIDLPWVAIRDATKDAGARIGRTGGQSSPLEPHGPHCALGEIYYPGERKGYLLYVKSSITGDESDYIVDYARRYPDFPHETTADQLFSEEQFEVYRALGFHCIQNAFKGFDKVAMRPEVAAWDGPALQSALVKGIRDVLGAPAEHAEAAENVGEAAARAA